MARKSLLAKVSDTTTVIVAGVLIVGTAIVVAARKAKAEAKVKPKPKSAQLGGTAPPNAPTQSPPPEPGHTTAPIEESMSLIGMRANFALFVVGVEGTTKCKLVQYGDIPTIAHFDPFAGSSKDRTEITMDVVTTLVFWRKDGSLAGCLSVTHNLKLTYTPEWDQLSIDIQKKNPEQACSGFDKVSSNYGINPKFKPQIEGGLLSISGTLTYLNPPCDLNFVNVTMVPTVTSIVVK